MRGAGRGGAAFLIGRVRAAREVSRLLGRAIWLAARVAPGTAALNVLGTAISSALAVAQPWLGRLILNALTAGQGDRALLLAAAYAAALAVPSALTPLHEAAMSWLEDRAVAEVDRRLLAAAGRLPDLGRIERPDFHDEVERVRQAAGWIPWAMVSARAALGGVLTVAGLLALLAGLHPLLPLALLAVAVPSILLEGRHAALSYETLASGSQAGREMAYCVRVSTTLDAAKEVRVFGLAPFFLARFEALFAESLAAITRVKLGYLRRAALLAALHAAVLAGGFWYVASRAGAGRLSLGDLALYLGAIAGAEAALANLPSWCNTLYQGALHTRDLLRFTETTGPTIALAPTGTGRAAPAVLQQGIALRGVSFRYPQSTEPVLEEVSITLAAGRITALVGANGAGKSTLVKLLSRMYDPVEGAILLDGVPLREYDLASLRTRIAVVYQDFARFALTVDENIGLGQPSAAGGETRRRTAARWAGADAVAAKLPAGYATELTRRFSGGVDLSGGEWQTVALARGFARDAALVILDEPSAALDADAESRLFQRFRRLMAGRTALLISHRFSTVRLADHIVVLEGGRVREQGAHHELLAYGGRYAALFETQAGRYR